MNRQIKKVGILLGAGNGWGRGAIEGIMAYEHTYGPWYLRMKPSAPNSFTDIPEGWEDCNGYIAAVYSEKLAEKLHKTGLPVVNLADCPIKNLSAPNIRTDDAEGTRIAVEHFMERGFNNLAFVGPGFIANAVEYEHHFMRAVEAQKLSASPSFHYNGSDAEMLESLTDWLFALPKPTGILVWGHGYAQGIVDACMLAGISVPHDIAILSGSNDDFLCNACYPPLSGVLSPMQQIGHLAAETLNRMMNGEKVPNETLFLKPTGIRKRLSTDTLAVNDPQLRKVVAYMKQHACESITVGDVLAAVPMARSSLEHRFQNVFGRTPAEELRRLRINRARSLLAETDLPMQDIAEACGFSSYNYLSFAFKKVTGMAPRDYRKQVRIQ